MHENVISAGCSQSMTFKKLKKLMETPPKVDRNRTTPPCRICPCYQPEFRYRKCLYSLPLITAVVRFGQKNL